MTETSTGSRQVSCPDCGRPVEPGAEICACGFPLMFLQEEERGERPAAPTRRPGDDDDTGPIPVVREEVAARDAAVAPPAGAGASGITCSVCGEGNDPGRTWCARCGSALRPRRVDTEVLPPGPAPAPTRGRRRAVVALAGVLLVTGAGGAAAGWYFRPDTEQEPVASGEADAESPGDPETGAEETTPPAAEPGPLPVAQALASVTGDPSNEADLTTTVTYEADNMVDGDFATAWRARHAEDADPVLTFVLEGGPREVTAVGLVPGYAKTDPNDGVGRFPQNRRVTLVEWRFDDGQHVRQAIPSPRPEMTVLELPEPVTASEVSVVILETDPPSEPRYDNVAVSEVQIVGR